MRVFTPFLVLALLVGCAAPPTFPEAGSWVDLTHDFADDTIVWPTSEPFQLEVLTAGHTEGGYYYSANRFCMAEHGGTHLDAPIHFAEGKRSVEQIPLEQLIGPAAVIDVTGACADDPDYQVSVDDFRTWEAKHGRLPEGAIVLLNTGFAGRWPLAQGYMGTDERGPEAVAKLHFPGLHPEAATWLTQERRIGAIGLDTPSIDYGQSTRFESHVILFEHEIPAFENVAALGELPAVGATVLALPMKIRGGTGAPLRIVAYVPPAR